MPLLTSFSFALCTELVNNHPHTEISSRNLKITKALTKLEESARRLCSLVDIKCCHLISASQYVLMGLRELKSSMREDESMDFAQLIEASQSLDTCNPKSNAVRTFQSGLKRLRQAELWAAEASLCKANTIALRAMALDIRLFCCSLSSWTELRTWFIAGGRRSILRQFIINLDESIPCDPNLHQEFIENVHYHLNAVTKNTVNMIMALISVVGISMGESVVEYSKLIDECVLNSRHLQIMLNANTRNQGKSFLYYSYRACPFAPQSTANMKSYLQHSYGIRIASIDSSCMFLVVSGFESMAMPSRDVLWVTDATEKLLAVSLNLPFPDECRSIDDSRRWTILGCSRAKGRLYAIGTFDSHISIFNTMTGEFLTKERILLPALGYSLDSWRLRVLEDGSIFACNTKSKQRYLLTSCSIVDRITLPSRWHAIEGGTHKWKKYLELRKDDQLLVGMDKSRQPARPFLFRVSLRGKGRVILDRISEVKNGKLFGSHCTIYTNYRLPRGSVLLKAHFDLVRPYSLIVYALTNGQAHVGNCSSNHSQILRLRIDTCGEFALSVEERRCLAADFLRPSDVRFITGDSDMTFISDCGPSRVLTPVVDSVVYISPHGDFHYRV